MEGQAKTCTWCGDEIKPGEPTAVSHEGDTVHFGCALDEDDRAYSTYLDSDGPNF